MYAIVDIAGKQFKVEKDKFIFAPSLAGDAGDAVEFDKVLLLAGDDKIDLGAPTVKDAKVSGIILEHVKGDKVLVFKKKRRKGYRKKTGHRQGFSKVLIESIGIGDAVALGKSKATETKAAKKEQVAEEKPSKETTSAKTSDYQAKDLLKSLGTAKESEKDDLKKINGIGPVFEKDLNELGIYTFEQISNLTDVDITFLADHINGVSEDLIRNEDWVGQAKNESGAIDLLKNLGTADEGEKDDLKKINGIGPVFEKDLNELGIYTFKQISKLTKSDIAFLAYRINGVSEDLINNEDWVTQAKQLLKEDK